MDLKDQYSSNKETIMINKDATVTISGDQNTFNRIFKESLAKFSPDEQKKILESMANPKKSTKGRGRSKA